MTSERGHFILYDIPSRDSPPRCWSLNPWKARLALNYKGVSYTTSWTEYPDIAPTFKSHGIPPNDSKLNPNAEYSCPAVKFPDGRYIMDSRRIAEALETFQPQPSLHMDRGEEIDHVQKAALGVQGAIAPIWMRRIPERILPPRSAEYFSSTRAKRVGMPLDEFSKSDKAGETAWENARPHLEVLRDVLSANSDGPYVMGKEVSFSDLIMAGFWDFLSLLDQDGDVFGRVMEFDGSFKKQHEACSRWLEEKNT